MRFDPFLIAALVTAGIAAVLLVWFLVRRPALTKSTKVILMFGIGILPLMTAATGNVAGFHATTLRSFCGSCHVMTPYREDSDDKASLSLAARHARNQMFGETNCYTCHADYGMYGVIVTKMGGLRHVYEYTMHYRNMPVKQFLEEVQIRKPFPNSTCIHCHSTENPMWSSVPDHTSTIDRLRAGTLSCASEGCHGPAHPFSKEAKRLKAGGH